MKKSDVKIVMQDLKEKTKEPEDIRAIVLIITNKNKKGDVSVSMKNFGYMSEVIGDIEQAKYRLLQELDKKDSEIKNRGDLSYFG